MNIMLIFNDMIHIIFSLNFPMFLSLYPALSYFPSIHYIFRSTYFSIQAKSIVYVYVFYMFYLPLLFLYRLFHLRIYFPSIPFYFYYYYFLYSYLVLPILFFNIPF